MACQKKEVEQAGPLENRLLFVLDEIEKRVENFRVQANNLEQEKEDLLRALHMLGNSKELVGLTDCERGEIQANAERLVSRCLTVEVTVSVPRSDFQEKALKQAHEYLNKVKGDLHDDFSCSEKIVHSLLNACCAETPNGPVDSKFQSIVLGCTAEDQKNMRKQLRSWLETLHKARSEIANDKFKA